MLCVSAATKLENTDKQSLGGEGSHQTPRLQDQKYWLFSGEEHLLSGGTMGRDGGVLADGNPACCSAFDNMLSLPPLVLPPPP